MTQRFRGVYTIPVTPFSEDGAIDFDALRRVVDFCLACGAHGIVAPVNASEFSSLSDDERRLVAETVIERTAGRAPVVIGVSGVSAEVAVMHARHAEEHGADAVIAMPPYVRKASSDEVFAYFAALDRAVSLPIFIQNYGPPVGTPLSGEMMGKMVRELEHVSYIKEELGPPGHQISSALRVGGAALAGVMGGMAGKFLLDEYRRGACGTMPACEATDVHVQIWDALEAGDAQTAREIHTQLLPMLSFETNFGTGAYKEILRRRGVLTCTRGRAVGHPALDADDHRELDAIMEQVRPYFRV